MIKQLLLPDSNMNNDYGLNPFSGCDPEELKDLYKDNYFCGNVILSQVG